MSMQLSREGIVAGPSSGEALHGLLNYLQKTKDAGKLGELADPHTGEISCVFICCDLPYQHLDGYFQKLSENEFPPIFNNVRELFRILFFSLSFLSFFFPLFYRDADIFGWWCGDADFTFLRFRQIR